MYINMYDRGPAKPFSEETPGSESDVKPWKTNPVAFCD